MFFTILHMKAAYEAGILLQFCFLFCLPWILIALGKIFVDKNVVYHLHHYMIFGILALFCRFDIWWSQIAMGSCLGIMMNGIAAYSAASLIEEVDMIFFQGLNIIAC